MNVSQRLFLGVVPSIVGLLTVAALAYWGQYARSAPLLVVAAAAAATLISILVAWRNTRYVARRVERLAGMRASSGNADELDAIEKTVDALGEVAAGAKAEATRASEESKRRTQEYARLIAETSKAVSSQLEEARLSLHVLQESHFGELNDNQEEMINAARDGVEAAETELKNLRTIADTDRGQITMERNLVKTADVIRSLLPLLKSRGASKNVRVMAEIDPGLPRARADRARLQDALGLIFNDSLTYAIPGTSLSIHATSDQAGISIVVNHGAPHSPTPDLMLAQRLISAQEGSVSSEGAATVVKLERGSALVERLAH